MFCTCDAVCHEINGSHLQSVFALFVEYLIKVRPVDLTPILFHGNVGETFHLLTNDSEFIVKCCNISRFALVRTFSGIFFNLTFLAI